MDLAVTLASLATVVIQVTVDSLEFQVIVVIQDLVGTLDLAVIVVTQVIVVILV